MQRSHTRKHTPQCNVLLFQQQAHTNTKANATARVHTHMRERKHEGTHRWASLAPLASADGRYCRRRALIPPPYGLCVPPRISTHTVHHATLHYTTPLTPRTIQSTAHTTTLHKYRRTRPLYAKVHHTPHLMHSPRGPGAGEAFRLTLVGVCVFPPCVLRAIGDCERARRAVSTELEVRYFLSMRLETSGSRNFSFRSFTRCSMACVCTA